MRIDTSEPSLVSLFEKGQVGLIRTEFMRLNDVIGSLNSELERLKNTDPDTITGSDIVSDPAWSIACFRFHRQRERDEIARLRKAGDNLERVLTTKVASYEVANASHEWRAAKENSNL